MKQQIISSFIITFALIAPIFFMGCVNHDENQTKTIQNITIPDEDTIEKENKTESLIIDGMEMLEHSISTFWLTGCCGEYEKHQISGFYHKVQQWSNASYFIKGKLKNKLDATKRITINISFHNENNEQLFDLKDISKQIIINNISHDEVVNFSVTISPLEIHNITDATTFFPSFSMFHSAESIQFHIKRNQ